MAVDHPGDRRYPALRGAAIALLAAVLFGISAPLVQLAGAGVGSFTTAALLYAGASAMGLLLRQPVGREARLRRADAPRLLLMALFGAGIAPVAFAWGLQHADGTSASLMLTLEAVFTAVLARWFYGETWDRRVLAAMALLTAGGAVLVLGRGSTSATAGSASAGLAGLPGLGAVLLATAAWGVDNSWSRALAERDPGQVVMCKGALGAAATAALAVLLGEPALRLQSTAALLLLGATGYGLSLRFYLLAQRAFGAARTGSVFSFAPFIGAALAALLASRIPNAWTWLAAMLMVLGIALHLLEQHTHEHLHEPLLHEHAHVHDDGHHTHAHTDGPPPGVAHSHLHRHAPLRHAHAHVPDEHHGHRHS